MTKRLTQEEANTIQTLAGAVYSLQSASAFDESGLVLERIRDLAEDYPVAQKQAEEQATTENADECPRIVFEANNGTLRIYPDGRITLNGEPTYLAKNEPGVDSETAKRAAADQLVSDKKVFQDMVSNLVVIDAYALLKKLSMDENSPLWKMHIVVKALGFTGCAFVPVP